MKNNIVICIFIIVLISLTGFISKADKFTRYVGTAVWDYFEDGQIDPDNSYKDLVCQNFHVDLTEFNSNRIAYTTYCSDSAVPGAIHEFNSNGSIVLQPNGDYYWHYCKIVHSSRSCYSTRITKAPMNSWSFVHRIYADEHDGSTEGWIITAKLQKFDNTFETSENWKRVFDDMLVSSNSVTDDKGNTRKYVSKISPVDVTKPHVAYYVVGRGIINSVGSFVVRETTVVLENWTIDDKNQWNIDQWIFKTTTEGVIQRAMHYLIVETRNGTVLDHKSLSLGSPDEQNAVLNLAISSWY